MFLPSLANSFSKKRENFQNINQITSFTYLKSSSSFAIELGIAPYTASKALHDLAPGSLSSITNHLASPRHLSIPKAPQGDLHHRALTLTVFSCPEHCLIKTISDHPIILCHSTLFHFHHITYHSKLSYLLICLLSVSL